MSPPPNLDKIHADLMTAVGNAKPISEVCMTTIRAEPHTLQATLLAASNAIMVASILIRALIIARQELQPQYMQQKPSYGVVIKQDGGTYYVTQVQPNSPADGQLDIGDIILNINGQPVSFQNVSLLSLLSEPKDIGTKLTLKVPKINKDVVLVSASVPTYNALDAALHEAISEAILYSHKAINVNSTDNTDPFRNENYKYDGTKQFIDDIHTKLLSVLTEMNTSLSLLSPVQPPLSTRTIVGLMKNALDIVDNIMMGVKMMYSDWSREGLNILGNGAAKYYCNNASASSFSTIKMLKEFSNTYLNTYLSANAASANAMVVATRESAAAVNAAASRAAATPRRSFLGKLFGKKGGKKTRNKNKKNKKTRMTRNNNKNKKTKMTPKRGADHKMKGGMKFGTSIPQMPLIEDGVSQDQDTRDYIHIPQEPFTTTPAAYSQFLKESKNITIWNDGRAINPAMRALIVKHLSHPTPVLPDPPFDSNWGRYKDDQPTGQNVLEMRKKLFGYEGDFARFKKQIYDLQRGVRFSHSMPYYLRQLAMLEALTLANDMDTKEGLDKIINPTANWASNYED